jgi:hypothetical protein
MGWCAKRNRSAIEVKLDGESEGLATPTAKTKRGK